MKLEIREARLEDAEALLGFLKGLAEETDIYIAVTPDECNLSIEQERAFLKRFVDSENSVLFVAEANGGIIGLLNCQGSGRYARRHVTSLGMSVGRAWRNQGVGSALVEKAIAWCKSTNAVKRIELSAYAPNQPAIRLYEKYGFEIEGRRHKAVCWHDEYIDEVIMALML